MKKAILLVIVVLTLFITPTAMAAQESVWDMAQSPHYGKKAGGMLGRGLVNAATCFVDVIVQTVQGTQNGAPFVGTLTGLGGGIGCTALRATSGVLDVATFWVPGFNGIPVGRSYENCLEVDEVVAAAPAETTSAAPQPVVMEASAPAKADPMDYVKK